MLESGKECTKCGIHKIYSDFHRKKSMKDGFRSACKPCTIKENGDYAERNADKVSESKKSYRESNRDKLREKSQEYRELNVPARTLSNFNWRRKYADRDRPKRAIESQRRRARVRKLPYDFTESEWTDCLAHFESRCCYCGKEEKVLHQDHFIPVTKDGGYTANNIVPACLSCNSGKKDKDYLEWYKSRPYYDEKRAEKISDYLSSVKPEVH